MQLLKIYYAYFSPGNTTEKVVSHIASSFQNYPVESINLTDYATRQEDYYFKENELLIIGVPAYGGRVPAPVVDALRHFTGSNTPVVLVATYGNRDIDDTLIELKKNVIDKGFIPVGAASFVCQHTFLKECAEGRPDEEDLKMAEFSLDGRMTVRGLKENFKKCFGATLRVYTTPACKHHMKALAKL